MEEEVLLLDENDMLPEGAVELPPENIEIRRVNEAGEPIDDDGNVIPDVPPEPIELNTAQLAQAVQGSLTQIVQSFDAALRVIRADIDDIKRFEGKQEGKLEAKLEEFDNRIGNVKTRLGKIENSFKTHSHKNK